MEDKNLLTFEQLSDYLQISIRTLRYHLKMPNYPIHHVGRSLRFKKDDVLQWYEQNAKSTRSYKEIIDSSGF